MNVGTCETLHVNVEKIQISNNQKFTSILKLHPAALSLGVYTGIVTLFN